MDMYDQTQIEWDIKVPIFKNKLIVRQLGLAIGIPFGILLLLFLGFAVFTQDRGAWYAVAIVVVLLLLTFVFVMIIFRGIYDVHFAIDDKGIDSHTNTKHARKARAIGRLAFWGGLLRGMPGVAGAGLLSENRQRISIRWDKVRTVKYYPRSYTILIKENPMSSMGIFCTAENYTTIEQFIRERV